MQMDKRISGVSYFSLRRQFEKSEQTVSDIFH